MNESDWHRIQGILVECATSLMGAFGLSVARDAQEESRAPKDGVLAIIGFGGGQMRGSLVVSANPGLLAASFPVHNPRAKPRADHLQDWAGELANQLLGRLKSRLLGHGITILLGTPTTVSGLELRVRSCGGDRPSTPVWLHAGEDWLVVRLDAIAADGVKLDESPIPGTSASEGEVFLF